MTRTPTTTEAGTMERGLWVWRFVDYEGRFAPTGMPADREVAQYLKWYLNAWQGPGGEWLVALNRLRAEKEFLWYQGAVVELLTAAMNQCSEYQGYLVTGRKVPMRASDVGSMLRVEGRKALAVLTRLEQVGILERVEWPLPDHDSDGDISDNRSLRLLRNVAEASRKAQRKGGGKRRFRNENEGPPLNKVEIEKAAAQQTVEVGDEGPPGCASRAKITCPRCGHVGQAVKAAKGWGAKAVQCSKCHHVTTGEHPTPKTSTPSTSPDGGGGPARRTGVDVGRKPSPSSVSLTSVVRMADVLADQGHRYSREANEFGEQVLAALGWSCGDPAEFRNEVAHWAKQWEDAASKLTDAGLAKLRAKVLRVAAGLRTGIMLADHPRAFLLTTTKNEIRDQKRAHRVKTG